MLGRKRSLISFGIAVLLCVGIWHAVPYNNFALNNSFVSDGYLPEIALFCMALLILVLNPLLRRFAPSYSLSHTNLSLIVGMMLFAAVLPSNGLLRFMPHCIAYDTQAINLTPTLATAIQESSLPAALFPDEIGPGLPTPASDQLLDVLEPGNTIPWSAWLPPIVAWSTIILAFWLMMIGLGVVVYPQWRHNERLSFPLLRVYHAMIDEPAKGTLVPEIFRSRLFWMGCGLVVILHSFNGLAIFSHGQFPEFPVSWDISNAFTEGVWRDAPGFLKRSRIYFLFLGLAYFMPNRYSFSIWFTVLFFGLIVMLSYRFFPLFSYESLYDQGCGALITISIGIVWLGRHHYKRVLGAVFRRNADEVGKTNALGGRLFLLGCLGIFAWFVWAGAGVGWSLFFVIMAVMIMMIVARIVAETGITYVWIIPLTAGRLIGLVPQKWASVSTAFLQEAHYILSNRASAVSVAVMMILTLGLNRKATQKSARQWTAIAFGVLVLGLVVCGAVHFQMGYTMATSFDSQISPITGRGARLLLLGPAMDVVAGRENLLQGQQLSYIIFGMGLAGVLLYLCTRFPGWPLHPIGLIFVHSSIGLRLFFSLLLGWIIKSLILRYGGAGAYRTATPLFLGFILGEVFANVFWTLVPIVQILFGVDPSDIQHMIIFQYT